MIRIALAIAVSLPMLAVGSATYANVNGITSKSEASTFDRRRARVPGGSGCDTPRDIRQHPECRA